MTESFTDLRYYKCVVCSEHFGRTVAASQYFLQLAGYIGIPVISWNADNSGFERRVRIRSSYSQLSQQVPRIQMPPYFICQVWLCML